MVWEKGALVIVWIEPGIASLPFKIPSALAADLKLQTDGIVEHIDRKVNLPSSEKTEFVDIED